MTSEQSRQKIIVIAGMVVLICAAVISYLVIPEYKIWKELQEQEELLDGIIVQQDLTEQINNATDNIDTLSKALHGEGGSIDLMQIEAFVIKKLEHTSIKNQVRLISVQPQPRMDIDNFKQITFLVKVSGGYGSIYQWLLSLRKEMGFIAINQLKMSKMSQAGRFNDPEDLLAELKLVTYRVKNK
jgi:Tfp pilus assembly protein PilO